MSPVTRMPPRVQRLNVESTWGVECAPPEPILRARAPAALPPYHRRPPVAWFLGLGVVAAAVALLAGVGLNDEFTAMREELAQHRRADALWTACRPPREGERLAVYLSHSTVVGGMEYSCVYDTLPRRGQPARRSVTRVAMP